MQRGVTISLWSAILFRGLTIPALLALSLPMAPGHAAAQPLSANLGLPLVKPWLGDFDAMRERRIIRILVPYSKTLFFIDRGRQLGVSAELGRRFEDWLNKRYKTGPFRIQVAFVPTRRDQILPALKTGLGDIAAANLTVTAERQAQVAFAPSWSDKISEIVVTGPASPQLTTLDDLAGRDVPVRLSSSYATHLEKLNQDFTARALQPLRVVPLEENLEDEDILTMVNAGLLPFAIVDSHKAEIWATILDNLKVRSDLAIASEQSIAWAFRQNSPQLASILAAFVAEHKVGTKIGNDIKQRYFKDDKLLKNSNSADAAQRFAELEPFFRAHAGTYNFDWLMLTAQGFQESQLDQHRRSPRGAVGIMQLLPSTAADKTIAISGIETDAGRNIQAGAAYLRYLIATYIKDANLPDREKMLFAFAAYNAGPGNLKKFRSAAKAQGLDPNLWFDNVEHAAARTVGRETVDYVSNIYKYYVSYRLLPPSPSVCTMEEAEPSSPLNSLSDAAKTRTCRARQ
ncbi:Membrane-bound lytic murein transglycosylase MltF [Beijerinckia sp. 28-YEA-48]|nr:Membrane-bound lytic murein transglycosylase MltF [Beijerinckia sp. 28-YEA-48]